MDNLKKSKHLSCVGWKLASLCLMLAFSSKDVHAEDWRHIAPVFQQTVKGKVVDSDGNPLTGVTVAEKGTNNSTQTNIDGSYSLAVPSTSTMLVFSSVGFEIREIVASRASNVILNSAGKTVEEVVVVGYGTRKRANMTGAVAQVDKEVLENRPSPTVVNMLQGAAPGLVVSRNSGRPGAQGLNIEIRGSSSANGIVSPLYVIDGAISTASAFTAINPNDIESISVLKDGGSAAIYGAQAAGGVILVTTKGGVPGNARITFTNNTAFQTPANIPDRLPLVDEMNYMNLARANAGLPPEYTPEDLNYAVNGPTFVVNPANPNQWLTYNQENLLDYVVRDSYGMFNNNLQMSGGSENVSYLASLGNMTQNGMLKVGDDRFERWNARANISAKLNDYFKLDLRSAYINEATNNPVTGGFGIDGGGNGILRQFFSSRARFPIFNEDGTYFRSGTSSALGYALLREGGFDHNRKSNYTNNITATIGNFVDGLQIRLIYGREDIRQQDRVFNRTVTYYGGPNQSLVAYQNNPNNYSIDNRYTTQVNYQALIDYNFSIASDHNFSLLGGYHFQDLDYQSQYAFTRNLYVNDNPSLNFTADPANKSNSQNYYGWAMQSYFGRLNYDYKGKYIFETTIRSDESSRLSPESRVTIFPSFSAGWNITNEDWFDVSNGSINTLKPRVSWGKVGSQGAPGVIGYFDYIAQLEAGSNLILNNVQQAFLSQSLLPAIGLQWEIVETRNVGIDFALLNNKLTGSFDYYHKYNNNMLVPVAYPQTVGIGVPRSNDGQLKTWGWELSLGYRDKIGSEFTYGVTVNVADNQNRLINYGGARNAVSPGVNSLVEGYALNSIWAYRADGYFQNAEELANAPSYERLLNVNGVPGIGDVRYSDLDGDGMITPGNSTLDNLGDLEYLGDTNPRYQYGVNINMGYKGFDFSMFVQGIGRRNFKPSNELIQPAIQSWYLPMSFQTDYWTEDNRDATFPRPYLAATHNYISSSHWFMSGAYARLKNVQLGYSLTKDVLRRLPFSRIRFYLSGEDLLTVSRLGKPFKGVIDPEMKPEDGKVSPYPFAKTYSFGINIDF